MEEVNEQWVRDLVKSALEVVNPDDYRVSVMWEPEGVHTPRRMFVFVYDKEDNTEAVFRINVQVTQTS